MPFDYVQCEKYQVDMKRLYEYMKQQESNRIGSTTFEYTEKWFRLIQRAYTLCITNPEYLTYKLYKDEIENNQLFQKTIYLKGIKILFHINIYRLQLHSERQGEAYACNMNEFSTSKGRIIYSKTELIKNLELNKSPILLVSLPLKNSLGFVADGNHRVTSYIYTGKKDIRCYQPDPDICVECLYNIFEKVLYLYLNDIFTFEYWTKKGEAYKSPYIELANAWLF